MEKTVECAVSDNVSFYYECQNRFLFCEEKKSTFTLIPFH